MSIAHTMRLPRRMPRVPGLMLGGYIVAALDMAVAMIYWAPHGVPPGRILQGIAAWLLGPSAFAGGSVTMVLGAFLYGQLLWGVMALYHVLAQRYTVLHRRPLLCGGIYGVLAYVAIFKVLQPVLTGTLPSLGSLAWIATCLLSYAILVGMPCALVSRMVSTDYTRASTGA